ncbi:MAG: flagellar export chaperone FlgN [Planctomycetales bacterium]
MERTLLDELKSLVGDFESAQDELQAVYARKRAALVEARSQELAALARTEGELAARLRAILARRGRLLQQAGRAGIPADSLAALAERIGGPDADRLRGRIERGRSRSEELRRESWIHWIIARRASRHYGELIELVAGHGRRSPVYEQEREPRNSIGGAILDASA